MTINPRMKYPSNIHYLKPVLIFIIFLATGSCTKDKKSNCYLCTTTWIVTTDQSVPNYPAVTTTDVEMCDISQEQVTEYENTNKGSESSVIGGVTYTSSYSTKCDHE